MEFLYSMQCFAKDKDTIKQQGAHPTHNIAAITEDVMRLFEKGVDSDISRFRLIPLTPL